MLNLNKFFHQSFEKVAEKFFRKIQYGNLRVSFPSGEIFCFKGKNQGINADIKLNNFLIIKKLLQKGSIGFAESYMDGDFLSDNLTNLLLFAQQNESNYIINNQGPVTFYQYCCFHLIILTTVLFKIDELIITCISKMIINPFPFFRIEERLTCQSPTLQIKEFFFISVTFNDNVGIFTNPANFINSFLKIKNL